MSVENKKEIKLKRKFKEQKYNKEMMLGNEKEINFKRKFLNPKYEEMKKTKPYNLQEIFEKKIKVGRCFSGLYDENYRIVKILEMHPEKNYVKVLVDDESKHKTIKCGKMPKDTDKIKYDLVNGYWSDDNKFYVKIIHFLIEKEIVYYGVTINDKEHKGGCFGGDPMWHHKIFSDSKTKGYIFNY